MKLLPTATGVAFCSVIVSSDSPMYTLNPVATAGGFTAVTTGRLSAGASYVVGSLGSPSCPLADTQLT